ncbi:LAMI_0F10154g1_1 [Lachancea mirantina]|uniref:4a-hydroxytetrahydrobiopterin dehydratase n=1 Tax=Lachancea mirantina TaxID=1230905 RepID=A0A1G4K1L4_9SACH|nr:LAMI_0F10154g1_1 [Lachancea mirantina]
MYNLIKRTPAKLLTSIELEGRLLKLPRWQLTDDIISRQLEFPDFEATWSFLNQVALRSHLWGHHPKIVTNYNQVLIELTTHDAGGITDVDAKLAARIDLYAMGREKCAENEL